MMKLSDYHLQKLSKERDESSSSSSSDGRSDGSASSFSSIVAQNREAFRNRDPNQRAALRELARPSCVPATASTRASPSDLEYKPEPKAFGGSMSKPEWLELTHGARVAPRGTEVRLYRPY